MRLLVCIKQVPDDGAWYPGDGTWSPGDIDNVSSTRAPVQLDPFSACALEGAARIKDRFSDTQIIALGLGDSRDVMRECLAIAADEAWLLERLPAEPLAASWWLSKAVQKLEVAGPFDAICCGDQSILGDCRPLGAELAEWLDRPQITGVLEAELCEEGFLAYRKGSDGEDRLWAPAPCLLAFTRSACELRTPTMPRYLAANRSEISSLFQQPLSQGEAFPRMEALHICPPRPKQGRVILRAEEGGTAADQIIRALSAARVIEQGDAT